MAVFGVGGATPWCWWCRPHISSRSPRWARAKFLSAAAVSLVNRNCRASFMNAIALIINYLSVPLGVAFVGRYIS